jgi:drug/metabolite transporter (DMT)-like permease
MTSQSIPTRAWAELILLGIIWGAVFPAVAIALDEMSVMHVVAHRLLWAALVLWLWVLIRRLPIPTSPRLWGALVVMGILNNALPFTLLTFAQTHIESGLTAIFNAATALFGVLVAALFLADERLTRRKLAGVLIGLTGVITAIGWRSLGSFDPRAIAQLAAIAATLAYAFGGVWARKTLSSLAPEVSAMGMLTASSLIMLALSWGIDGPLPLAMSLPTLAAMAYSAVIATAIAYLLYYRILAMAGSGNLMLVTLLVPPVAIILGTFLRGESLTVQALLGFALIALGLIVLDGRLFKRR